MKVKDLARIRRRLRAEKNNIRSLYGCYVNEKGEVISEQEESISLMAEDEAEQYFSLLRKSLSGRIGKNILELSFPTDYVRGDEHFRLLSELRNTKLEDPQLREELFRLIREAKPVEEGSYVILLSTESFDVPARGEEEGGSFRYLLCCVCPVKENKASLCYQARDRRFSDSGRRLALASPSLGFLWPALEDGGANLYSAMTLAGGEGYEAFIKGVFDCDRPSLPAEQKSLFGEALRSAMGENPSFEDVMAVTEQLGLYLNAEQEEKGKEPVSLSPEALCDLIGQKVELPETERFCETCREILGEEASFNLENLWTARGVIELPGLKISMTEEGRNRIRSEKLNGKPVLIIQAGDGLQLDGENVEIR